MEGKIVRKEMNMEGNMATATEESKKSIVSVCRLAAAEIYRQYETGKLSIGDTAEMFMDIASVMDLAEYGWKALNQDVPPPDMNSEQPG